MTTIKTQIITGNIHEIIDYVRNNPNAEEIREMINLRSFERDLFRTAAVTEDVDSVICDAGFAIGEVITHFAIRIHGFAGWYAGTIDFIPEDNMEV